MTVPLQEVRPEASGETELERMIGDTVRRLFAAEVTPSVRQRSEAGEWIGDLWRSVSDAGLTRVLCSEAKGGTQARWSEAWPLFTALGRWAVPLPIAETIVASAVLDRAGRSIPEGPVALSEGRGTVSLRDGKLSGSLLGVAWAGSAVGHVLARVRSASDSADTWALIDLESPTTRCLTHRTVSGEPVSDISLEGAVPALHFPIAAPMGSNPARLLGALTRSAMMVGAMEAALEMAVTHVNDRQQFGRPLAKFQAIQHALATAAGELLAARMSARIAFLSMDDSRMPDTREFDVAVAKTRGGRAAAHVAASVHQAHGAIGFTQEHGLHHLTRRLWSWRQQFGSDAEWAERLGRSAIQRGATGYWAHICDRQLSGA